MKKEQVPELTEYERLDGRNLNANETIIYLLSKIEENTRPKK